LRSVRCGHLAVARSRSRIQSRDSSPRVIPAGSTAFLTGSCNNFSETMDRTETRLYIAFVHRLRVRQMFFQCSPQSSWKHCPPGLFHLFLSAQQFGCNQSRCPSLISAKIPVGAVRFRRAARRLVGIVGGRALTARGPQRELTRPVFEPACSRAKRHRDGQVFAPKIADRGIADRGTAGRSAPDFGSKRRRCAWWQGELETRQWFCPASAATERCLRGDHRTSY
jgi:hypothetical protein